MNVIYTIIVAMCNKEDREKSAIREGEIVVPERMKSEEISIIIHETMLKAGHPVFLTGLREYEGNGPVTPLFTIEERSKKDQDSQDTEKEVKQA